MDNPFSQKQLEYLFQTREGTDISYRREGLSIEFRENFHLSPEFFAKTAKTMAAYANNRGGYLIFGVTNKPHHLQGMKNEKFQEDPNKLSQFLATHFQPTIFWEIYTHSIAEKNFGLIYVHEAKRKPIVASSSFDGQYREGEILYRYVSESKSIKAPDLIGLIESRIEQERKEWQNMLTQMASINPANALLLNTVTGKLDAKYNTFVLSPELLEQIKWVKEGQFKEKEGAPTLKLIGEVQTLSGQPIVATKTVPIAITKDDIFKSFLNGKCDEPKEYLRTIPYTNTVLMPIWYFIKQSELQVKEISDIINSCNTASKRNKEDLIKRLKTDCYTRFRGAALPNIDKVPNFEPLSFDKSIVEWRETLSRKHHLVGIKKLALLKALESTTGFNWPDSFWQEHIDVLLQAITWLKIDFLKQHKELVLNLLKLVMEVQLLGNNATLFRKAICYVDFCLYAPDELKS